jgi:hypothetical protein
VKQRTKLAVVRILSLHTEFSDEEINDAITFIEKNDLAKIFNFSNIGQKQRTPTEITQRPAQRPSRILLEIKETDPEKFEFLSLFDQKIRDGVILSSLDEIRRVGTSIDKSFYSGKSLKDATPKLIALLSRLSITEMHKVVENILAESSTVGRQDDSYNELATFLIRGKK